MASIDNLPLSEKLMKHGFRDTINKNKWVSPQDFVRCIGVGSTGQTFSKGLDTYVMRDPSEPPLTYNFRNLSPKKWLFGSFKH